MSTAAPSLSRMAAHSHAVLMPTLADTLKSLASMLILALFILTFIAQPFRIPSESMERTLLVGDFLLVNKQIYGPAGHFGWLLPYREPQRGDVIVFRFPLQPEQFVVKRIVAVPGDRLHLDNGVVVLNGHPLKEPYVAREPSFSDPYRDNFPRGTYTDPNIDPHWWTVLHADTANGDVLVPAGSYFVMGDNRNFSRDSRYWGFVPRAAILGRPFLIYFSLREPSTTAPALPADGKLGQADDPLGRFSAFARWDRMFRVVR